MTTQNLREMIDLLEGQKEMQTIIDTIRDLGMNVSEIGQYLEKTTGKNMNDITDNELQNIVVQGVNQIDRGKLNQIQGDPDVQQDVVNVQRGMNIPAVGPNVVANQIRKRVPSGKYRAYSPDGKPMAIDVDVSGDDLTAIKNAAEKAGITFPQALQSLKTGDFSQALRSLIKRTNKPN